MQYRTVNYALGYDGQQFGVGNAVEVFRQVGINDVGVALMECVRYVIYRIVGGFLRPEPVRSDSLIVIASQDQGINESAPFISNDIACFFA